VVCLMVGGHLALFCVHQMNYKTLIFSPHLNFAIFLCRKFAAFLFRAVNFIKQCCFLFLLVPLTNVIIEIHVVLLFTLHNTKNIAYHITEVLIFSADKFMVTGSSKNLRAFNFTILLKLRKSQKFDAREIYMFYSI